MNYSEFFSNLGSYVNEGAIAAILSILLVYCGIVLIITIISLIGQYKILKKAGQEGWPAIIPIYGTIKLCQIVGVSPYWLLIIFGCNIIPYVGTFIGSVASIYFLILLCVSLSKSFGKSEGFAVGLFFLSPIFYMILGCSDDKYLGARPMSDFLFKTKDTNTNMNSNTNNNMNSSTNNNVKYCSNCGAKVENDEVFCTKCGNRL